ncbi:capsule assembly Wzi family protein [candidate division KSB1 bacterium]
MQINLSYAQSVYVPLNHPVYKFIDRLQTKGFLKNFTTGTKPYSRVETADFLIQTYNDFIDQLSGTEKELLSYYEQEFAEEINQKEPSINISNIAIPGWVDFTKSRLPDIFYGNYRNLLEIKKDKFNIFVDVIAHQDIRINDLDSISSKDRINRYTTGIQVRGNLGENLGFFIDARNTKEWGNRKYRVGRDQTAPGLGWINNMGDHQYHDETIAYIVYNIAPFELEFGKNLNKWGPGYRGSLMLSDNATSYDLVKLKTRFWKFNFAHVFGYLQQFPRLVEQRFDEEAGSKNKYSQKYIAAHRLELNLLEKLNLGFQEAVIYGQRGVEIAYLNPLMFLRSAEHYLGDQDNALMGADINYSVKNGLRFYGEFLMDDIYLERLGTNWIGNKFAYIGGLHLTDPFNIKDTSLRLEYTRIKPFVYTHTYKINVYKHYDTGLGHYLPPNSDEIYLGIDHYFSKELYVDIEYSYIRHGKNPEGEFVGGNIDEPWMLHSDSEIRFLEGDVEKIHTVKLEFSYELFRNMFFRGEFEYMKGSNFTIQNIPGRNLKGLKFFTSIGINY